MGPSEPSRGRAEDDPLLRAFFERREALILFLASRTRSMAMAEDLVQDLYVKLSTTEVRGEVKSPQALLYRMAVNLMTDQVRSVQRSARRDGQWREETHTSVGGEPIEREPGADEALLAKERVRLLAAAVKELPPQMQRAFRLHKLEGKSQAETAEAMGVSRKMVEQHIQAAIRNLSQKLRT
ncbi:RNA polymerase sigma factor [Phenylobacterium sp. J367]|uniref:RNA polymerase sigma factor n=1 Tax=Phenylobacterium sp. J367 TaxID=2898435 RepID=UPI002151DA0F|nr:sigma-70 family RNA polymerase sigma factor [Phenylobacterium sp. J367]MCR5880922.1 sigma-70 family RNA polymerase sigma factor [Phenylobacterium sp. J367]